MDTGKTYYEDSAIKVTESFVAVRKKVIIPLEKIVRSDVNHKSISMYLAFIGCVLSFGILFFEPFFFIPVFGGFAIWFRYIYEHYVELSVYLVSGKKYMLRIITLRQRSIMYDTGDAIEAALSDYRARTEKQKALDTDTLRIRRIKELMLNSEIEKTPEIMAMLEPLKKKEN